MKQEVRSVVKFLASTPSSGSINVSNCSCENSLLQFDNLYIQICETYEFCHSFPLPVSLDSIECMIFFQSRKLISGTFYFNGNFSFLNL